MRITRDCNDAVLLKASEKGNDSEDPVLLPHFSCHYLRHTFTTRLCEAGVNVKVIQDILGHADITTTLNIYADVTKDLKQEEIRNFQSFFDKVKNDAAGSSGSDTNFCTKLDVICGKKW